jgi:NAD(P)H dehydrogenase (quinone)
MRRRYGRVAAQLSAFFDRCGQLWATGALAGKFVSTSFRIKTLAC